MILAGPERLASTRFLRNDSEGAYPRVRMMSIEPNRGVVVIKKVPLLMPDKAIFATVSAG